MRKLYSPKYLSCLVLLLTGAIGCHQDPVIPASAIPGTCQIYRIANVNEGVRDTTTYAYNAFGHVQESTYRQWVSGLLTVNTKQKFTYSADHFLMAQADQTSSRIADGRQTQDSKSYTYIYLNGQIQQITINNTQSGQPLGANEYVYENGRLKTYTETNAQKVAVRSYAFDGTGKLTQFTELGTPPAVVTNGKITKRTLQDGTIITCTFDGQGQLTSDSTVSAIRQIKRTYTYDNAPYWNKTQLLLRGIPVVDLGGHTFVHNILKSTTKVTENGRVVQDQTLIYQREYTKETDYSLGYGRSDGARQNIAYTNCP